MQKPWFDATPTYCINCTHRILYMDLRTLYNDDIYCTDCWDDTKGLPKHLVSSIPADVPVDNILKATVPEHYHKYGMDTLEFLEKGFPPEVVRSFCLGNVIKYSQRYKLKGGIEDLEKAKYYLEYLLTNEKKELGK